MDQKPGPGWEGMASLWKSKSETLESIGSAIQSERVRPATQVGNVGSLK